MNGRASLRHHWLARVGGAILVVCTSHPARVAGSNDVASQRADVTARPSTPAAFLPSHAASVSKLVGDLADHARRANPQEMVDVVVAYDSVRSAAGDARRMRGTAERSRGYSLLPFRAMRVPAAALDTLSRGTSVRYVIHDNDVLGASNAGRQAARVPGSAGAPYSSNAAFNGLGVRVAVIDSGVAPHADFPSLVAQYDFLNGAVAVPMNAQDRFGHGTHVAGMIGSSGQNSWSQKYQGVGTAAGIVSMRVLDDQGRGRLSDVIAALDWTLAVARPQLGVRVVNLSLGQGVFVAQEHDPLVSAVDVLWNAGVVVVVSAGNHGESGHYTVTSPANSRRVITVGSLTDNGTGDSYSDDYVSSFSSRGPTLYDHVLKPDILAPGNRIIASYAENSTLGALVGPSRIYCGYYNVTSCSQRYMRLSGTSMAAGLVSGAVARMLQKDPTLTPDTVKARLMKSARKIDGDPTETGAGLLDVDAAMNATGVMNVRALSPLMQLSSNGELVYVQDTAALWGSSQWDASHIWASGYLWTNAAPMGANGYLWSNSYLWSNNAVWANSFLWSNGFLWSDSVRPSSIDVEDPGEEEQP